MLQPFDVKMAGLTMNVAGSNGIDQSLEYDLGLKVPKSLLGGGANQAIAGLVSKTGVDLSCGVGDPARDSARRHRHQSRGQGRRGQPRPPSVAKGAEQAVKQAVAQKVDSAALRVVAEAERQAAGDPAAGRVAGREGQAGGVRAGRRVDGEGRRRSSGRGRRQARRRPVAPADGSARLRESSERRAGGPTV